MHDVIHIFGVCIDFECRPKKTNFADQNQKKVNVSDSAVNVCQYSSEMNESETAE